MIFDIDRKTITDNNKKDKFNKIISNQQKESSSDLKGNEILLFETCKLKERPLCDYGS